MSVKRSLLIESEPSKMKIKRAKTGKKLRNNDFYIETEALKARPEKEIADFIRNKRIAVEGSNILRPVTSFSEIKFPKKIEKRLTKIFKEPTPIQSQAWPFALSGRDMVGIAPTGSGKTLAFILPALVNIINNNDDTKSGPNAVVIIPTQELGAQIEQVAHEFGDKLKIKIASFYSGVSKSEQIEYLKSGINLCISTPARFLEFLETGVTNMDNCSYLVLDEATRMLDLKFETQIRRILQKARTDCQILMWSATWSPNLLSLVEEYQKEILRIHIGALRLSANPDIEQIVHICGDEQKIGPFLNFFEEHAKKQDKMKVLVFAETKLRVKQLAKVLQKEGHLVVSFHAGKSQEHRISILEKFRKGQYSTLVASDLAARGIDVDDVTLVVNFDFPATLEEYVHRVGRTGRKGKKGLAYTLLVDENIKHAPGLVTILEESQQQKQVTPALRFLCEKANRMFGDEAMEEIHQSEVYCRNAPNPVPSDIDDVDLEEVIGLVRKNKGSSKSILSFLSGSKV